MVKTTCYDLGEALESISYSSFHCRPVSTPGLRLKRHFSPAATLVPSSNNFEVLLQPRVKLVLMSIVNLDIWRPCFMKSDREDLLTS